MVLWANMHAGFTLGIVLAVAAGLDAVAAAKPGERAPAARAWIGFCVLTLLAASLTPYGPQSMLVTYRVLSQGEALTIIGEWRPPDFGRLGALEVILLAAAGLALHRGFRLAPVRVLVLLGLLHDQFALGGAPGDALAISWRRPAPIAAIGLAMVTLLAVGLAVARDVRPNARITPAAAVAALQRIDSKRLFNDYDFGGYLIFAGVAPFIDGRTDLYGGAFTARHHRAVTLADLPDFIALLDEYEIAATLLSPQTPAAALLDRLPGWRRLHADDVAVVHVRLPP
jgi:hypothetical protein